MTMTQENLLTAVRKVCKAHEKYDAADLATRAGKDTELERETALDELCALLRSQPKAFSGSPPPLLRK
jgi:hypothetical protein